MTLIKKERLKQKKLLAEEKKKIDAKLKEEKKKVDKKMKQILHTTRNSKFTRGRRRARPRVLDISS